MLTIYGKQLARRREENGLRYHASLHSPIPIQRLHQHSNLTTAFTSVSNSSAMGNTIVWGLLDEDVANGVATIWNSSALALTMTTSSSASSATISTSVSKSSSTISVTPTSAQTLSSSNHISVAVGEEVGVAVSVVAQGVVVGLPFIVQDRGGERHEIESMCRRWCVGCIQIGCIHFCRDDGGEKGTLKRAIGVAI